MPEFTHTGEKPGIRSVVCPAGKAASGQSRNPPLTWANLQFAHSRPTATARPGIHADAGAGRGTYCDQLMHGGLSPACDSGAVLPVGTAADVVGVAAEPPEATRPEAPDVPVDEPDEPVAVVGPL